MLPALPGLPHTVTFPAAESVLVCFPMSLLRRIEKGVRRLTLALLAPQRPGSDVRTRISGLPAQPRILLIRIDRIGDAIVSTPTAELLRKLYPDSRIDLLLGEKNRIVGPMFPFVDNVLILLKGFGPLLSIIRQLRKNRYDIVINLHLNQSAGASTVARLAKGGHLLEYPEERPFGEKEAGTANHNPGQSGRRHVVSMTSGLLAEIGIDPLRDQDRRTTSLTLTPDSEAVSHTNELRSGLSAPDRHRGTILMNVTASHSSRRWSMENYAELAARLREQGFAPILCGAPEDDGILRQIKAQSRGTATTLEPVDRYPNFVAALGLADIVVTPDTSTVHAAAAMGRPTVVLYPKAETAVAWSPWGVPHRWLSSGTGMNGISVEEVYDAIIDLYTEITAEGGTTPQHSI